MLNGKAINRLFFLSSCRRSNNSQSGSTSKANNLTNVTLEYAILKFDTTDKWFFKNAKPTNLTQREIEEIEIILKKCIDVYNPSQQLQYDTISKAHREYNLKPDSFVIKFSNIKDSISLLLIQQDSRKFW